MHLCICTAAASQQLPPSASCRSVQAGCLLLQAKPELVLLLGNLLREKTLPNGQPCSARFVFTAEAPVEWLTELSTVIKVRILTAPFSASWCRGVAYHQLPATATCLSWHRRPVRTLKWAFLHRVKHSALLLHTAALMRTSCKAKWVSSAFFHCKYLQINAQKELPSSFRD